ncbi:MAG: SAM-dependent methyltransferase [Methylotenera sp.]|jgi:SAM-dependent MidA family methyltransferase|nr:SAM-dependent methyltransferase [Methylotenera sp.]HPH09149.1 SAM-dependent methyltransferase [Methylotenera sp.]HPM49713.1 SAM-dependent methyltransferase [Methylotenera sp.]HPV32910.1 SAM-dependent methyltransferase [Methylotenera sp.]
MSTLPKPAPEAEKHSEQLVLKIQDEIQSAGGWLDFARFMQLALYATGLGYYSAGSQKFGDIKKGGGDFVTAPQISPLFAQTLANQMIQVLQLTQGSVLELGAGTGKLAADCLLTLAKLNGLPERYFILEVSDHLRQVQLETLSQTLPQDVLQRVEWLNELPQQFAGIVIGNEVLDAIPVNIVHKHANGIEVCGIAVVNHKLVWQNRPINQHGTPSEKSLFEAVTNLNLPEGYTTEINPAASGLMTSLATILKNGAILMIDYGFSAREYYHPQRNQGTLMCHYQHYAHTDPLIYVGLQDITAHVDFTSIAHAAVKGGLSLSGFCSQAQFLMNCGILTLLSEVSPTDMARYAPLAAAAQKLLSPAEMGDLFKVIAFTKEIDTPLMGFLTGDKSHTL